jgi:hypothetical protein
MWRLQTRLGTIPYYMFIERDTGPRDYFSVPLAKAYNIYKDAGESSPFGLSEFLAHGQKFSLTP